MTKSTAMFLLLHLMCSILFFGCLLLANKTIVGAGERGGWYFLAGILVYPLIGTLKDFCRYYQADLNRQD